MKLTHAREDDGLSVEPLTRQREFREQGEQPDAVTNGHAALSAAPAFRLRPFGVVKTIDPWIAHCYEQARICLRHARFYPMARELFLYSARRWRKLAREARRQKVG